MEKPVIKTFFLSIVIFVLGLITYLYFYLGAYKPVTIRVESRGPFHLLYKTHTGPYHEIGPTISEVEAWAKAQNIPCAQTFGEYLDDPQAMDQDRLRSQGGCVLSAPLSEFKHDFHASELPETKYVVAHFEGSPSISPFKVYPKVKDYLEEHRLTASVSVIEIYSVNGEKVTTDYLFNITNP
jgi:AraC family transcriptional regulator